MNSSDFGTLGTYFELETATDKIKELEMRLAEKDKEIEKLRQTIIHLYNTNINLEMYSKTIREQVCEEIRKSLHYVKFCEDIESNFCFCNVYVIHKELLDQIEKGE